MRWGEHLWGQPALDVEGEGGADVGVVARIVHQHNLIQLSSASGMSSMHIFHISLLVVDLIPCGKAVSIKENTDKILLEQVKVKHIQLRNTKFLDGLQKAPCTFGRPTYLKTFSFLLRCFSTAFLSVWKYVFLRRCFSGLLHCFVSSGEADCIWSWRGRLSNPVLLHCQSPTMYYTVYSIYYTLMCYTIHNILFCWPFGDRIVYPTGY